MSKRFYHYLTIQNIIYKLTMCVGSLVLLGTEEMGIFVQVVSTDSVHKHCCLILYQIHPE